MLVLSRKVGEQIMIGDNITLTVQRVSGSRVSVAIEAPRDVNILRGELAPFGVAGADAPPIETPGEDRQAAAPPVNVKGETGKQEGPQPYAVKQFRLRRGLTGQRPLRARA